VAFLLSVIFKLLHASHSLVVSKKPPQRSRIFNSSTYPESHDILSAIFVFLPSYGALPIQFEKDRLKPEVPSELLIQICLLVLLVKAVPKYLLPLALISSICSLDFIARALLQIFGRY